MLAPIFGGMPTVKGSHGRFAGLIRGLWIRLLVVDREDEMRWRVIVELGGAEGTVQLHEVSDGGSVTVVARRHRISESVLYNWRSARKAATAEMQAPMAAPFIPLGVLSGPERQETHMLEQSERDAPRPAR
jgi:hypothetical protein